ncbi:MAG: hypothetical protein IJL46_06805 [Clostridia bacterium]|nr:hypothetical protein [Clostridia bacterium]MBQ5957260.1 hypothetical protein [Clostridia bacterium]MBR3563297.1 hypothetical protein [Clostridia bacterium]MBR6136488.1 hypothetical protein [Clostridia bacterium]
MKKRLSFLLVALLFTVASLNPVFAVSGNNPPQVDGSLPYYTSRTTIYNYVYTAKRFKPNDSGKIYYCFSGDCSSSSPATLVTWRIEVNSTNYIKHTYSLYGSSFSELPQKCITGLDTDTYYHGVITKNNSTISLEFVWGFGKTAAQAQNYVY